MKRFLVLLLCFTLMLVSLVGCNNAASGGDGSDADTSENGAPDAPSFLREGNTVYFGEYPQSVKAADVTVGEETDSRGYFLGSDGSYYAQVTAASYDKEYKFSTDAVIVGGEVYYFKVEPIAWTILSEQDGKALLLCNNILAKSEFDEYSGEVYSNSYAESDIRAWLNETFYATAFSDLQKQLIETVTIDNSADSAGYASSNFACEDTQDKVFLLSYRDVTNASYGFSVDPLAANDARGKVLSDFVRAQGLWMSKDEALYGKTFWWLRSAANYDKGARFVTQNGKLNDSAADYVNGVVPALYLRLS